MGKCHIGRDYVHHANPLINKVNTLVPKRGT